MTSRKQHFPDRTGHAHVCAHSQPAQDMRKLKLDEIPAWSRGMGTEFPSKPGSCV